MKDQSNANDNTQTSQENADTGRVLPKVQPSPESGSSEVPDPGGTGGTSGDGTVQGQTSGGVGEQTPVQDGVGTGQALQEVALRVGQTQVQVSLLNIPHSLYPLSIEPLYALWRFFPPLRRKHPINHLQLDFLR